MSKPYTKEVEQDELILAAIIAGGMASGREVRPSYGETEGGRRGEEGHTNVFGFHRPSGPCCAVGAGVLFAEQEPRPGFELGTDRFARLHGVDHLFAVGVSDGFEDIVGVTSGDPEDCLKSNAEFLRGYAVGAAAYDFFHGGDE